MKITKKNYTQIFGITVVLLAIFRCASIDRACGNGTTAATADSISTGVVTDSMATDGMEEAAANPTAEKRPIGRPSLFFNADGTQVKNRIYSVPHFGNTFPDQNDVQLAAAQRHGVKAVLDRKDAERRKSELVYVGNNPFFHVDRLNNSIPYLVPSASELLQDIGKAFFDSLQTKQIPLHKIIVTSVLRSKADVAKLRQHNSNATENSCHLYGTTFDVCYNRYKTVEDPQGPRRRQVRNDSLKWVLSEVLNDMRQQKRCLVKYEVKQGCFHITVN
ncbi:DUF5715 family protein [Prevotella sp.]|uniref:DUF5715 family protein n=1 Tax=uncultured Prevotella sp. TaxID=159272 RepID=UPI0027E33B20|nr:DUF5715 family protein [uncultured Prevotella sp.]